MTKKSLLTGLAKCLGALLLALVVLWPTVKDVGTEDSEVVVQVMEKHVQILIDDQIYWVDEENERPIVCQIQPGRHVMRVLRQGNLIQEVEFSLQPGQQGVLTAWDPERANAENRDQERRSHEFVVLARHPKAHR